VHCTHTLESANVKAQKFVMENSVNIPYL
jgi:hypothetical protein